MSGTLGKGLKSQSISMEFRTYKTKIDLSIPPVYLFSESRDKKFLECNQSEWAEIDSCFDDRFPFEVE